MELEPVPSSERLATTIRLHPDVHGKMVLYLTQLQRGTSAVQYIEGLIIADLDRIAQEDPRARELFNAVDAVKQMPAPEQQQ